MQVVTVVEQFLKSEESYVNLLNTLMDEYITPLQDPQTLGSLGLTHGQRDSLCFNVEALVTFKRTLYDALCLSIQECATHAQQHQQQQQQQQYPDGANTSHSSAAALLPVLPQSPRGSSPHSGSSANSPGPRGTERKRRVSYSQPPDLPAAGPSPIEVFASMDQALAELYDDYVRGIQGSLSTLTTLRDRPDWQRFLQDKLHSERCGGVLSFPILLYVPLQRIDRYWHFLQVTVFITRTMRCRDAVNYGCNRSLIL